MNEKIKTTDMANLSSKALAILIVCGLFFGGNSQVSGAEPLPLNTSKAKAGKVKTSSARGHQTDSEELPSADTTVLNKPSPCLVTVVTVLKSKETYERSYPFDFKTEQECKKSAERHSTNFNPEMIEKVTSTYVWTKGK